MPLYEYKCRRCGQRFEKLVGWKTDPKQITCPTCAAAEPERLISLPAAPLNSACAPAGRG